MNRDRFIYTIPIVLSIIIISCAIAAPVASAKEFIPTNFAFSDDYYTVNGAPNIFTSVAGDTEFDRGEIGIIRINLANKGVITKIRYAKGVGNSDSKHKQSLQELEQEVKVRVEALGITAVLISDNPQIDIVAAPQVLESLKSGDVTEQPFEYSIMINDNAAAGTYLLNFTVQYQYVDEVRMSSNDTVRLGVTDLTYEMHYATAIQSLNIPVIVKPAADFDIIDVDADVQAKGSGFVNITYKNTGELPAYDAVARLVVFMPLSMDKSQHFLGTIESGDIVTASFYVSTGNDAIVKAYAADSEIKYLDEDDETMISDNMKVSINVLEDNGTGGISSMQILLILMIVAFLSYIGDIVKSRKSNDLSDNKFNN